MKLQTQDVKKVLKNHGITHLNISFEDLKADNNIIYVIKTFDKKYVLKIFNKKYVDVKKNHGELINFLVKKGIKTPKVYPNFQGEYMPKIKNRFYLLKDYVEGQILPNTVSFERSKSLGKEVSKIHDFKVSEGFEEYFWPEKKTEFEHLNKSEKELMKKVLQNLSILKSKNLSKGFIHGDLVQLNFIFKKNELISFIDWDFTHVDFFGVELGIIFEHCYLSDERLQKDRIKKFLQAYTKKIKLKEDDYKLIREIMFYRLLKNIDWGRQKQKEYPNNPNFPDWVEWETDKLKILKTVTPETLRKILKE